MGNYASTPGEEERNLGEERLRCCRCWGLMTERTCAKHRRPHAFCVECYFLSDNVKTRKVCIYYGKTVDREDETISCEDTVDEIESHRGRV